ncbi:hypothetical protein Tco_0816043, partial [Tanacetum coccineum]
MTKQGNFTQRTPQAKKQSDQASRQVSKQASGSTNTPYDLVFPATGPSLGTTQPTATITSTEDLQRAAFTTPPQTAPGTNTTEPPPPPIRNKGPELGADNLTLEGVATELAPSDFVSQNYETLVALMQEETKKRSSQSLQARLNFGPEDEVSPPRHRKERRRKDNRRPLVFGRIGKQVSGTQTANLQNLDTHENNDWRISVRDRLGSRDVHSRLGQRRSPSESPPSSDSEDSQRRRRRRVSSSSEDSSDNEDAETGHWKSKTKICPVHGVAEIGMPTIRTAEKVLAKIYNLIIGADTQEASTASDELGEFALMGDTSEHNKLNEQKSKYFIQVQAYKNSLKTLEKQKRVLQKNQLTLEDMIRVLSIELENTTNLLKHSEIINAIAETAKKELQTKLDNHFSNKLEKKGEPLQKLVTQINRYSLVLLRTSSLGFNNYISENELGWDDSAFSVFTTNSEEVEGRPLFNRFAKTDSMKAVPPPLSGDYTPLSDHIDLDESQMSYGTKSSTSGDSNSVSNDFVSCDNSDKSSEVNTNDFASSESSVKSSEPKSKDSTSYASTSSELPSFSCTDKDVKTFRTPCNKNGYFNKKTQYANDFDGVGNPQRKQTWDNASRVTQSNHFVPQAVPL